MIDIINEFEERQKKIKEIMEGNEKKSVNPPNTSSARPPKPEGSIGLSKLGQEFFDRTDINIENPDLTIVKVEIEALWGKNEDNGGGIRIGWISESAGFGHLTIWKDLEGNVIADTETMSKEFCKKVLNKLVDTYKVE